MTDAPPPWLPEGLDGVSPLDVERRRAEALLPAFERLMADAQARAAAYAHMGRVAEANEAREEYTTLIWEYSDLTSLLRTPGMRVEHFRATLDGPKTAARGAPVLLDDPPDTGGFVFTGAEWVQVELTRQQYDVLKALKGVFPGVLHLRDLAGRTGVGAARQVIYKMRADPVLGRVMTAGRTRGQRYGLRRPRA
jgi:hypothetical protein